MSALGPVISDPVIPWLAVALDAEAIAPRLREILESSPARRKGPWRLTALDVLKYKPGRRCSVGYTLDGPDGRERLFAKVFASNRGASIFTTMDRFWQAMQHAEPRVPRPLAYFADIRLLVTEHLDGIPLATALYAGGDAAPARRIAAALAVMHSSGVACVRRWTAAKEIRSTTDWIAGLSGRSGPSESTRAHALLGGLTEWSRRLPSGAEGPIHRDFYADQIWDCGGTTAILDLDDARTGDPAVDLGNCLAHFTLRKLQFPAAARGCDESRGPLLDEYRVRMAGVTGTDGWMERVRFYEASSLLRLAGVYSERPRWSAALPARLIDACDSLVMERP